MCNTKPHSWNGQPQNPDAPNCSLFIEPHQCLDCDCVCELLKLIEIILIQLGLKCTAFVHISSQWPRLVGHVPNAFPIDAICTAQQRWLEFLKHHNLRYFDTMLSLELSIQCIRCMRCENEVCNYANLPWRTIENANQLKSHETHFRHWHSNCLYRRSKFINF